MKKILLTLVAITFAISNSASAQSSTCPYGMIINNDSTFTWNDSSPTKNNFIEKVDDHSFVILRKNISSGIYEFVLNNDTFTSSTAVQVSSLKKVSDIKFFGGRIYIADQINNQAYVKVFDLTDMFDMSSTIAPISEILLQNMTYLNKIDVYDSSNVKIIVGMGIDDLGKSSLIKYYETAGTSPFNKRVKYFLRNAIANETFLDIVVTNNYIKTFSSYYRNGKIELLFRKFQKNNFASGQSPTYLLPNDYVNIANGMIIPMGDNVCFGINILKLNQTKSDFLIGTLIDNTNMMDAIYIPDIHTDLFDISYSNYDPSIYGTLKDQDGIVNGIIKFPLIYFGTPSYRVLNYGFSDLFKIQLLNNRFILTTHTNSNSIRKSSLNFYLNSECESNIYGNAVKYSPGIYSDGNSNIDRILINEIRPNAILSNQNVIYNVYSNDKTCATCISSFKNKEEVSNNSNFINCLIYPNPVTNILNIESSETIEKVEILDMTGKQIFVNSYDKNSIQINCENFEKGSYVAKIYSESGVATKKVVVK